MDFSELRYGIVQLFHKINLVIRRSRKINKRKVQIKDAKARQKTCQICLGIIKDDLEYATCNCGKVFHMACIRRTGFCPYCLNEYEPNSQNWSINSSRIRIAQTSDASRQSKLRNTFICPICGTLNSYSSNSCKCGAIFVREGETFQCPTCGSFLDEHANRCDKCGERFEGYDLEFCRLCGGMLNINGVCVECGAISGEKCPVCGSALGIEDTICSNCGTAFELI